jgi:hypothetical protein
MRFLSRVCLVVGLIASFTLSSVFAFSPTQSFQNTDDKALDWPAITSTQRPWTYWWWMGNAADEPNIARSIERFSKAGRGRGAHIIPIYGARGWEDRAHRIPQPPLDATDAVCRNRSRTTRDGDGI